MAKLAMDDMKFEQLLSTIHQETGSSEKKLNILSRSRGYFNGNQTARLLYSLKIPSDKVRALRMLEPRMCRMSCSEARDVLGAFSIHNDRNAALECVKGVLSDCQTRHGKENILSTFPFENDKYRAMSTLHTVRSDVVDAIPAGGHQGYAALGGLYTQSRPLLPHLYGSVDHQSRLLPGRGKIAIPVTAKSGIVPSMYTGHPSYALPRGRDYWTDRGYKGHQEYSSEHTFSLPRPYPYGAPPLGMHQGNPAPTGFPGLRA